VEIERVVSGPGLRHLARFTHGGRCTGFPDGLSPDDEPPSISRAGLEGTCPRCREALEMFAAAIGAVAGNLALTAKATGGMYLGGGVPPRILPVLQAPVFLDAFLAKAPMDALVRRIPVRVILLEEAGLLGSAVRASEMAAGHNGRDSS
jgi:glucokinase